MSTPRHKRPATHLSQIIIVVVLGLMVLRWWQQSREVIGPAPVVENHSSSSPPRHEATSTNELPPPAIEADGEVASSNRTSANVSKPSVPATRSGPPRVNGLRVEDVVVKNLDGEVVFRGTVDLTQTLKRINENRVLTEYRNDGVEFRNLERRLPRKPRGHYREWVHPTLGMRGPGPQRVVTGQQGEAFYTWDHYDHFVRLRSGP